MQDVVAIFTSLNTWIVCFLTGALIWVIRQFTTEAVETSTWWKKVLRIAPLIIGSLVATIPSLMPVTDSIVQSAAVGFIAGSFSQSAYDAIRDYAPSAIKKLLGARSKRI